MTKKNYRLKFGEQDIWAKRSWRSVDKYVPSDQREGFDESKVEVVKPYKDHEWTGTRFEGKVGKRRRDG